MPWGVDGGRPRRRKAEAETIPGSGRGRETER